MGGICVTQVLLSIPITKCEFNSIIDAFPNVTFHLHPNSNFCDLPQISDCAAFGTFGNDFNIDILEKMPKLRMLQIFKAGVDTLPLKELKERKVIVTNVRGIHRVPVSEQVFSCMLADSQNLFIYRENQKTKKWDRNVYKFELFQKTIGIIGTGNIGQEIAKKAKVFGMYTLGLNSTGKPVEYFDRTYPPEGISELLSSSDYVLLALPLTGETRYYIDHWHFSLMKPTSCFINIARGQIVNEKALIDALKSKTIRAAILDVFEQEPLPEDSPLWSMDNVIMTPHTGGVFTLYMERALNIFKHNLSVCLGSGRDYLNIVDLDRGY